jgi:sulfite reductase (ferredoxin)
MFYRLPKSLESEIDNLEALLEGFMQGSVDPASLKSHRVPFGIYEQRQEGTYMARIRCPGGMITPLQFREVALLSERYGDPEIHITTRQELQIHGLSLHCLVPLLRQLASVGLSTRGGGGNTVRNVIVSPESGITLDQVFDVSPHARALTTRLIADPGSWLLPRKFKIAFSCSPLDTGYARFNDLGFIAVIRNRVRGFRVYVAGGMGSKPEIGHLLEDFVSEKEIFSVTEAVKRVFSRHGNRKNRHAARLRFLWREHGEDGFRSLYHEQLEQVKGLPGCLLSDSELDWEHMRPVLVGKSGACLPTTPEFASWSSRYLTVQHQPGLFSVVIPVLLGNVPTSSVVELADFLQPPGGDVVRMTTGQNIQLRNLPETRLGDAFELISRLFELSPAHRLLGNAIACAGADTCKLGICLPRGALRAIVERLRRSELDLDCLNGFRLNLSGCPNSCGQHPLADLGFYGRAGRKNQVLYPGYAVVGGAVTAGEEPRFAAELDQVSARDLPDFVHGLLGRFLSVRERFGSFNEYLRAEGKKDIRELCGGSASIPDFADDKNYYYDWGAGEQFSLVGKGGGECSAGLFDLIELDLRRIRLLRKPWVKGDRGAADTGVLREVVLCACRMLLVTRGVEVRTESQVFLEFQRRFLDTGLVEPRFSAIVSAARDGRLETLGTQAAEVHAFAEAAERLYRSMDSSFRFPGESDGALVGGSASPALIRDYRDVPCPLNFGKVKLDIASIKSGERLEILLAEGAPIQNVPRSVADEGHLVLSRTKRGNHWSVLVQKVQRSANGEG